MPVVNGKIYIKNDPGGIRDTIVYVRLLDTSKADASSIKITEVIYKQVNLRDLFTKGLQFHLYVDKIDSSLRYEINVLADLDKDGKMGKGDYITKQAYPVLTKGYPEYVEVEVSLI